MALLEMNHIRKHFGGLEVIKDISLKVNEGEILSIIGPSGSGKSTMLRCATMLETIDSGEIIYNGERVAWVEPDGKKVYPAAVIGEYGKQCFAQYSGRDNLPKVAKSLTEGKNPSTGVYKLLESIEKSLSETQN